MATMKNPTSSSSSFTYGWTWTYDVFISFRGVDTRSGFTGNLYQALCGKEVKTFKDDEDLEAGEEIGPALDKAIQESRIALVIFSKNYASSRFCLEELAKIIECSKDNGMLVWPVFYRVDPSDVRYQKGSYADALANHEGRFKTEKVDTWRAALTKAADVSGFTSNDFKYEYQFIDKIIRVVSKKISSLHDGDKNQIICNVDDKYIAQHDRNSLKYNEVWDLTTLKIAFHQATKNDVVIHTIKLSKQSAVEDVINGLKSKVDLSHPGAELRLLGVSDHTIKKVFSLREKIENISNKYETIRAEEIPGEEKNLGTYGKLIHVYHFKTYRARNGEEQIQNFGDPFFLVISKLDDLIDIKLRIQQKFRIPYAEISKWKFASVRFNRAEYLEHSISDRFKSGSTYGDWERYLGLEHADK